MTRGEYYAGKLRGLKKSLTAWFNAVSGSIALALPLAEKEFPRLEAYMPDDIYKTLAYTVIIGNFLIRFKTAQDLADK